MERTNCWNVTSVAKAKEWILYDQTSSKKECRTSTVHSISVGVHQLGPQKYFEGSKNSIKGNQYLRNLDIYCQNITIYFYFQSEKTFVYDSREDEATARVEDLILLTAILMKQAKDIFLSIHEKLDKKHTKLSVEYSHHTFEFIETIKNDSTLDSSNLEDDSVLVDTVIKLLEKAVNFNPKILGCILRPFLKGLYEVTFTNSWHLEDIKSRLNGDELKSFGCFCKLVNSGEITPEEGLVDGVKKNWVWAKDIMELSENVSFRIVLMPDREQVNQYMIYPKQKTKNDSKVNLRKIPSRKDTFLGKSCFKTIDRSKGKIKFDLKHTLGH